MESSDQPDARRPRQPRNVLPLLVALQHVAWGLGQLPVHPAMLHEFRHASCVNMSSLGCQVGSELCRHNAGHQPQRRSF